MLCSLLKARWGTEVDKSRKRWIKNQPAQKIYNLCAKFSLCILVYLRVLILYFSKLLMKIWNVLSKFKHCSQTSNFVKSANTTQTVLKVTWIKWLISISVYEVYVNFICFWGLLQRLFPVCRKSPNPEFQALEHNQLTVLHQLAKSRKD